MAGIYRIIRKGNVKVNKKKKKQNYRLQEGDFVRVWEPSAPTAAKSLLKLSSDEKELVKGSIVYEDDNIILCNKPSGMVMHAGSKHQQGLSDLVTAYTKNPHFTFVHRIDKMTSGLVIGSKNLQTTRLLSKLIRDRDIEKRYLILVHGVIKNKHFTVNTFLKTEEDRVRVCSDETEGSKKSSSTFKVLEQGSSRTMLEAVIHTGRKHQLRVQLADMGYPIVGDFKYGKKDEGNEMFLFSQCLIIPSLNIHVSLPAPETFSLYINA
jgi:23S rRNA pseudouridine955/2504/2580 synthase